MKINYNSFTLIKLVLIIAIIALLVVVLSPYYFQYFVTEANHYNVLISIVTNS